MKLRSAVSLMSVAVGVWLLAVPMWSRQQQDSPVPDAEQTEATFIERCSTCHAEHGEGSDVGASLNVPDLRSASVQRNSDDFLRQFIKTGKGNMPAFGRDFSDSEIDSIVRLVRSFAVQPKQPAKP